MLIKVIYQWLRHPLKFATRVFLRFQANQGTLLAGAIAYHSLLSLVPLVILLLVALSHIVSTEQIMYVLQDYLEHLMPSKSDIVLRQVEAFLEHSRVLGWTMAFTLFAFSAAAFGVLQNAMKVIFAHRNKTYTRSIITALLLPYLYVLVLGIGVLAVTVINSALQTLASKDIAIFGWEWSPNAAMIYGSYVFSTLGQVVGVTLIYMLMPAGRIPLQHALIGGITVSLLWEIISYGLGWYFSNLSAVNTIYGSLAGVVIVLMTLYAISLLILIGAQIIAEYERSLPEFANQGNVDANS